MSWAGMLRVAVAFAAGVGFGASDAAAAVPDYEPLKRYGVPGSDEASGIRNPQGIGVDPISGRVAVADPGAERVAVFKPGGRFLLAFGKDVDPAGSDGPEACTDECRAATSGTAGGEFGSPWDAEFSPDGLIYVVERSNERVSVFTARGHFKRTFGYDVVRDERPEPEICSDSEDCMAGLPASGSGAFDSPSAASFGPDGDLYVTDSRNNRIDRYTLRGRFAEALGTDVSDAGGSGFEACAGDTCQAGQSGGSAGSLNDLRGIDFAPNGDAFVASWNYHRVTALSPSPPRFRFAFGKDVVPDDPTGFEVCTDLCWGGWGDDTPGAIDGAHGIAIDARGTVYVADANNHRINVYRRNGAFRHSFGYGVVPGNPSDVIDVCTEVMGCEAGAPRDALEQPHALHVDCRGTLFAASQANGTLTAFATNPKAHPGPCRLRPERARLNRRRGTAKLEVSVPFASRVTLNGKGVERSRARHRGLEGDEQLKIKPRGKLRRKLRRRGHARVRVQVKMRPTDGNAVQRRSKRITLRKRR